jgi:hypothetical protein
MEILCSFCGGEFDKCKKEITRQKKRGRCNFYCSKECNNSSISKRSKVKKKCLRCEKEFISTKAKKARKCCSPKCSSEYSRSFQTIESLKSRSNKIKKRWKDGSYKNMVRPKHPNVIIQLKGICEMCDESFSYRKRGSFIRKTCSDKCKFSLISRNNRANPNCGGKTNWNKFTYNGVSFDSSWEVEIAQFMDARGIIWERKNITVFKWEDPSGSTRRYHPDFYLRDFDCYLDPKNKFLQKKDKFKLDSVRDKYNINLISGDVTFIKQFIESL